MKEVKTTFGGYLDYISILEIKFEKQFNLSKEMVAFLFQWKEQPKPTELDNLYYHLKHINELIWWCMDKQREYTPETKQDRREIAMIVAELNDIRDRIKKEINQKFGSGGFEHEVKNYMR